MMSTEFANYNEIILDAFLNIKKQQEVAQKKKEILDDVLDFYEIHPTSYLFVGYSPCIELFSGRIAVTEVSAKTTEYLAQQGIECRELKSIKPQEFDVVIAVDEYLTFASNDEDQQHLIKQLVNCANRCVITTLRDYKNQDFKNREFSIPVALRGITRKIYLEHYDYDLQDRNASQCVNYVIDDASCDQIGPFARRNLFFKQLAKFSLDAGARNFVIHKNLMYKSLIKKNYEHIITIML